MKIQASIFILFAIAIIGGCKSTTVVENYTGTLRGNVALVDANGDTLLNYAGATAQIQGTSYQATSNAAGDWQVDNIPAGIYNILLTKPGFDTLIIPKYQYSGAGVSFIVSTAIQVLPLDSLVFTLTNTTEEYRHDSNGVYYLGLLNMRGSVSGPGSLLQDILEVSSDSGFTSDGTMTPYLFNDTLVGAAIGYNEPPNKSGTFITIRSHLLARQSKVVFSYFQQATSPYTVVRTFKLP